MDKDAVNKLLYFFLYKPGPLTRALEIIKGLPYPLCSLEEQTQIVKEIEFRLSVCIQLSTKLKIA